MSTDQIELVPEPKTPISEYDQIPKTNLPEEYISRITEEQFQITKVTENEKNEEILGNIVELNLLNKTDLETFMKGLQEMDITTEDEENKIKPLPIVTNITTNHDGTKWFMISPNSSRINMYDSENTTNPESKFLI
jgi:hypothetical protein